ncbi:MAG: ankyrin repeat domain-containing protein [Smithella sp.]|nr:ankyrin repeat domain-containing protein [Smithella sp.]
MATLKVYVDGSGYYIHKEIHKRKRIANPIAYQVTDAAVIRLWTAGIGSHGDQIPKRVFDNLLLFREIYTQKTIAELISAAAAGNTRRVDSLIQEKIKNVNVKDEAGLTALMIAAINGRVQTVDLLIAKGADVNVEDKVGETALMKAAMNGHQQTVDLLIRRGADVNVEDNYGKTALCWAEFYKQTAMIELLKANGAVS